MGFLMGTVEEMLGVKAFAHQAALHIHDAGDDGVDLARGNGGLQGIKTQVGRHLGPRLFGQGKGISAGGTAGGPRRIPAFAARRPGEYLRS